MTTISVENPVDWPQNYRRVPPYRPINRNLDRGQRPDGTNPIERVFFFTMLHGVWLNAVRLKTYESWLYHKLIDISTERGSGLAEDWRPNQQQHLQVQNWWRVGR